MILPILYKFASDKKRINQWEVQVQGNKFRTISGFVGMALTPSAWTECEGKNLGKSNETSTNQQAEAEALALHRKRIEKGYIEDINKISKITSFFEPMLAQKFQDRENELIWPLYIQRKYDGIRCIIKNDGMWTRNGKKIISAPHIFESIKYLFQSNPDLVLDGELFCEKEKADFNKIISLVRKLKPTDEDLSESEKFIEYYIYDIPRIGNLKIKGHTIYPIFSDRFINSQNQITLPKYCKWVETIKLEKDKHDPNYLSIRAYYSTFVGEGYEGLIVRLDGPYENKRSKYLLKYKMFEDAEFEIKGVIQGKGNMAGRVGKFQFETDSGVKFEAAMNATWDELEVMWKNREGLIGKKVTIKYFEITPKNNDGSGGVPRFPKCIAIRDYE